MIGLIASIDKDLVIGDGKELAYHIFEDMKHFRKITMTTPSGHKPGVCVMGSSTFKSMNSRGLSGRNCVVFSTKMKDTDVAEWNEHGRSEEDIANGTGKVIVCNADVFDFMIKEKYEKYRDCWVIGGSSLYSQFLPMADFMELTMIDAKDHYPNNKKIYDCNGSKLAPPYNSVQPRYFPKWIESNWEIYKSKTYPVYCNIPQYSFVSYRRIHDDNLPINML